MRRLISILSINLVCILGSSCDNSENDLPDVVGPEITILTPNENSRVKGKINISAFTEDISKVVAVKIYVDGVLIKEFDSDKVVAEFDTKTVSEGVHTIRIEAIDKAGNISRKDFRIEVRNILLAVAIPTHYVPENATIYFVLSKDDGSVIAYEEVENGSSIVIPTPDDFNPDSLFTFTEYLYLQDETTLVNSANVYTSVSAGEYSLPDLPDYSVIGKHHLKFTDLPVPHSFHTEGEYTGAISGTFGDVNEASADIAMRKETSDLFFSLRPNYDGPPLYKYLDVIGVGGASDFSGNELLHMDKHIVPLKSLSDSFEAYVRGYQDNSQRGVKVFHVQGTSDKPELSFYLPANTFSNYLMELSVSADATVYGNMVSAATAPLSFHYLDAQIADISYLDGKLAIETSGVFDVCMVSAWTNALENNVFIINGYSVSFPRGINKVNMPVLPQEIAAHGIASLKDLKFNDVYFSEYADVIDFEDYENKVVFSDDRKWRYDRASVSKHFSISTTSGGRLPEKIAIPEAVLKHIPEARFP